MVHKNPKFDLNKTPAELCCSDNQFDDTKSATNDGCKLVLGIGRTPSVCRNDRDLVLKLSFCSYSKSDLNPVSSYQSAYDEVSNVDDGSTSAKSSGGGYMPSLILAPRLTAPFKKLKISEPESSVISTETASARRVEYGVARGGGAQCSHSKGCKEGHGGGRRFVVDRCSRRSEEHAGLCVSHGGGTRLRFKNHTTNACGRTDISKAHGEFAKGRGGLDVAHGGRVQETKENKKGFLGTAPRLFHGHVSGPNPCPNSLDNHSLSGSSVVSNSTSRLGNHPAKRRQLIPPQVLVPSSMKSLSVLQSTTRSSSGTDTNGVRKSFGLTVPEGRVHGGSLLSFVGGNLRDSVIDGIQP